jgi:hypothetical protein
MFIPDICLESCLEPRINQKSDELVKSSLLYRLFTSTLKPLAESGNWVTLFLKSGLPYNTSPFSLIFWVKAYTFRSSDTAYT